MKKTIAIILLFLFMISACKSKIPSERTADITIVADFIEDNINDEYLHIAGRRYEHKLSELDKLNDFTLFLQPYDNGDSPNIEGIELLKNIENLTIIEKNSWLDLSGVDYSPLNKLQNLKKLRLLYLTLNEIPDFGKIPSLEWIWIYRCKITTMNGIEKTRQLKQLNIIFENNNFGTFRQLSELSNLEILNISGSSYIDDEWEKTVIRADDLSGLSGLKLLGLGGVKNIDLEGIQSLSALEILYLDENANIENIQVLSGMNHIKELKGLSITPIVTSLDFLGTLNNLSDLSIYGSGNTIDITPLKNLVNLEMANIINFTIMNFHILDDLPKLRMVYTYGSNFSPENNNKLKNAGVSYEHDR